MQLFTCPICGLPLCRIDRQLRCNTGHAFDLAREGYVNLLPSHHRRSAKAGDDSSMVNARRQFLDAGHYAPLVERLAALVPENSQNLLDIGCGEGYFTAGLARSATCTYGVDISKPAIRLAARRYPEISFAVANGFQLPVADESFDVSLVVLAPATPEVFRVTCPHGLFLRVSPGPQHLEEIKSLVYRSAKPHERASVVLTGFRQVQQHEVSFVMALDQAARAALLAMTPMAHRSSTEKRLGAISSDLAEITASFWIDVFERLPAVS